jgi:hypothetical protein
MIKVIYLFILFSLSFSQYYDIGETMITSHQNQSHSVCYGETDVGSSSSLKFADYNGAINGGDYHIILMDLAASW